MRSKKTEKADDKDSFVIKLLAGIIALGVLINFILFIFRIIGEGVFWSVIVISAVIAYLVIPRLNKLKKV